VSGSKRIPQHTRDGIEAALRRGRTQASLAKQYGVSPNTVYEIGIKHNLVKARVSRGHVEWVTVPTEGPVGTCPGCGAAVRLADDGLWLCLACRLFEHAQLPKATPGGDYSPIRLELEPEAEARRAEVLHSRLMRMLNE